MSTFSSFQQGTESYTFHTASRPPRQPRPKKKSSIGNLVESISRATSIAYDSLIGNITDHEANVSEWTSTAANAKDPISERPGKSLVTIDFWFFLPIYYGFYLLMGLFYMTSLFNLYNMNWCVLRI